MPRWPAAGFALAQRGFAPLDAPPSPAGASGAGATGRWPFTPAPGRAWGRFCRVKGPCPRPTGCGPHQPLDPSSAWHSGAVWCVLAGCLGWKGCQGRHRRPQPGAQRRDRARMPAKRTLDAPGSHPAYRPGGGTRRSRRACPRSQSGKIGRGMQPKGLPKRSAECSRSAEIQNSFTH